MKLNDIIYKDEYETEEDLEIEIENLTRDYEKITEGSLFFLLKGIKNDSYSIINSIKSKKPRALVTEREFLKESVGIPVLFVENVRRTMAIAFSRFSSIDYKKAKFIAVTGTNGKSTTATLIKEMLIKEGETVGFIGTGRIEINDTLLSEEFYSMTTPDPELLYPKIKEMLDYGCNYIVMEASSHALYFDKLAPIPFEIGIFTNLTEEHLDFHKDMESYYAAKLKLFKSCKIGIFNCDDRYGRKAFGAVSCRAYSIGILWPGDVMAREIVSNGLFGTEYIYRENALIFKVKTKLVGSYNIYNSMLALKALILLGFKPCNVKKDLFEISSILGRFEIREGSPLVIRDYAHTPFALENLLKTVKTLKNPKQNIKIVFGCGGERDKSKRSVMGKIAKKYCSFSIVTADNSRGENLSEIISDILEGFDETDKRQVITDRKKAIEYAIVNADENDVIIVAGKGCENYIIDKDGKHYFNEKEIIEDAFLKREEIYENRIKNSTFI